MKSATGMFAALCATGILIHGNAAARESGPAHESGPAQESRIVEEVIVRAHPLPAEQLAQSYRVMTGDELTRNLDSTLGATVGRLPGVTTTFFGQAVGRPVIRGLGGPRVRVMEDHIASLDASIVSDDHAVTIEPFLADSIDILKGPASLIYGSGAIGGIVDVHTGRVPLVLPDQPFSGLVEGRFDDVADQRTGVARLDGSVGPVAWHADGFSRRLKDYDIPGFAESRALRALEDDDDHDEDHDHEHGDEARGTLPNSDLDSQGAALGLSLIGEQGFIGLSFSGLDSDYGLPGGTHAHAHEEEDEHEEHEGHGEEHGEEEESVRLDLKQRRWDLAAGLKDPFPNFSELNVRIGRNDYEHRELEGPGEVGTLYEVKAWEARFDAVHVPLAGWRGVIGLQFGQEDFSSAGEEAYAPPSDTETFAVFVVEERPFERFTLQGGARFEHVRIEARDQRSRSFDAYSVSAGAIVPLSGQWELGLIADIAQRAPVAAELYSDGPHLATQSFEIGDPELDVEQATNLAATLRYTAGRADGSATLFFSRFGDFIYQAETGLEEDGLPVRVWSQDDADFWGIELEGRVRLVVDGPVAVDARFMYDRVRAEVDVSGNDRLPRMPPDRVGAGLEAKWQWLTAGVEYLRAMKQDETAEFELPTPAYDDLRAEIAGRFDFEASSLTVFLQGRNLTDDDQRNHVSFLKDYAPLPGRTVLAGMRLAF